MVTPCMNYVQYERGRAVQIRHIFNTRKDVQYESCRSSVKVRMCSTNQPHHQYKQGRVVKASKSSSSGTGGHCSKIVYNE